MSNVIFKQKPTNNTPVSSNNMLFNGDINSFNGTTLELDGTQWYDSAIGFKDTNEIEIIVPLKAKQVVTKIDLQLPKNLASGIKIPKDIEILNSVDGINYVQYGNCTLVDDTNEIQHKIVSIRNENSVIQSKFIKIKLTPESINNWTFIDEIKLYTDDNLQKIGKSNINIENVVLPNNYQCHSPLDARSILFDGNKNPYTNEEIIQDGNQWYDMAVGFKNQPSEIVIPFNELSSVHYVDLQLTQDKKAGIYIPKGITLESSLDGKTYIPIGESTKLTNFIKSKDHVAVRVGSLKRGQPAKFIRIRMDPAYNSNIFLDEVSIY